MAVPDRTPSSYIVVGVIPKQADAVIIAAAEFARRFDAAIVLASVDTSSYAVDERADGTVMAMPFNPDMPVMIEETFDPDLRARLASLLDPRGVQWSSRALAGDPAKALGELADSLDALVIIVGTREPTIRQGIREFFSGSVAANLAHRQRRPVVVIPQNPVGFEGRLPWTLE